LTVVRDVIEWDCIRFFRCFFVRFWLFILSFFMFSLLFSLVSDSPLEINSFCVILPLLFKRTEEVNNHNFLYLFRYSSTDRNRYCSHVIQRINSGSQKISIWRRWSESRSRGMKGNGVMKIETENYLFEVEYFFIISKDESKKYYSSDIYCSRSFPTPASVSWIFQPPLRD
jgi:hypothetical protein